MDESLKSARLTYLTLLAVCATVLLFGFSPSKESVYQQAIEQLESLASIDHSSIETALSRSIDNKLGNFDFRSEFDKQIEKYGQATASPKIDFSPTAIIPHYLAPYPGNAPLTEIESYFRADPSLYVFVPNQDSWNRAMRKALRNIQQEVGLSNARAFIIESLDLKDSGVLWKISNTGLNSLTQRNPIKSQATLTVRWSYYYDAKPQTQPVDGQFEAVDSATLSSWLKTRESLQGLTAHQNGHTVIFPKLRPVWDQIRASNIDAAIVSLRQKISAGRKQVTVLGLSVNEDVISLVAPLAILSLVIYLLTHLRHIWQISHGKIDNLASYPWVALFPDPLARTLTFVTLLALPTATNIVILMRVWDAQSTLAWIGLACFVFSVLIELAILRKLAVIQKAISSELATNRPD